MPEAKSKKAQRCRRMLRALSQRDTKVVLSLGGGGVRMFAHGVFLRLFEELGAAEFLKEVWGASAGAIIGMLYSQGMTPREIQEEALNIYRSQQSMPKLPSRLRLAANLVRDIFIPLHRRRGMKAFHDFQLSLVQIVARNFKKQNPRFSFFCTAYNVEQQDNDILTPGPIASDAYPFGVFQLDPVEATAASCAIPIIFEPKLIGEGKEKRTYLDGAMIEEFPTVSLYKKWMRDRELGLEKRRRLIVIGVNLHPSFTAMNLLDNKFLRKLPGYEYLLLSINCSDFMKEARCRAQKRLLTDDPNVELWEFNLEMPGSGMLNLDLIPEVLSTAEKSSPPQFAKLNRTLLG